MSELLLTWGLPQACPYSLLWVHGIEAGVYRRRRSGRGQIRNRNHPVTNNSIYRAIHAISAPGYRARRGRAGARVRRWLARPGPAGTGRCRRAARCPPMRLIDPDARVEHRVAQVDDQVRDDDEQRRQDHEPDHELAVPLGDRSHGLLAHSLQAEYLLDH